MLSKKLAFVALSAATALVVGCGGNKSNNGGAPAGSAHNFVANLTAMNTNFTHSKASGTATLIQDGSQFKVVVNANGVEPGIMHITKIHVGSKCPAMDADSNRDNVIDAVEVEPAVGNIVANLSTSSDTAPVADANGNLSYEGKAPVAALALDQRSNDMSNKVVIIHGVNESAALPHSAKALNGLTSAQSLPIACGVLMTVQDQGQGQGQGQTQGQTQTQTQSQTPAQTTEQPKQTQAQTKEQPKEQPKQTQAQTKEQPKEQPKQTQAQTKEQPKEQPKQTQAQTKEQPKEQPKQTQSQTKEQPKQTQTQSQTKEQPKTTQSQPK